MSDLAFAGRPRSFALPRFLTAESPLPWLFPITAMLVIFGIYPLGYSIWMSLHRRNVLTRHLEFVGGDQWMRALSDQRMWHALEITLTYTFVVLAVQLVLGMLIALLLDTDRRGYGFMRALMTLPLVVPPAVTGMMFLLMQEGSFGVLSFYLYELGIISRSQPILAHPVTALMAIMLADIWQWTPFMVLIMLAGLRALPKEPFEAAAIDGASAVQSFFLLTLPMLRKVIAVAVLIRGVDLFRIYDYVYIITAGGPGTATETLSFYAGRIYFTGDFSYAATLSLIIVVVLIGVSDIFVRLFKVRF
ncbi:MAG: carbohydrate ABC transporter permease [Rhizobiaceae bacterium]|jgi:multiple sugar transport system permease protein